MKPVYAPINLFISLADINSLYGKMRGSYNLSAYSYTFGSENVAPLIMPSIDEDEDEKGTKGGK